MQASKAQIEHLALLKTSIKTTYDSVGSVFCPVLNAQIVFNSIGFRHLLIKPDGTVRDVKEAIYKLTLFPLSIPTIKFATSIIEEREIKTAVGRGKRRKYKDAKTYAITAFVGRKKPVMIRVIILRIGDGNYNFYSIMKD
jgi:hypothetical protein